MYYLTVDKDGKELVRRMAFEDYGAALQFLTRYYEPRVGRGTLSFTTDVVGGRFARSFAELNDPSTIDPSDEKRYVTAAKMSNAFLYDGSYFFLIESASGIADADGPGDDE